MQIKIKFKFDIEEGKVKMKLKESSSKVDAEVENFYKDGILSGFTKSTLRTLIYSRVSEFATDIQTEKNQEEKETIKEATVLIDADKFISELTYTAKKLFI